MKKRSEAQSKDETKGGILSSELEVLTLEELKNKVKDIVSAFIKARSENNDLHIKVNKAGSEATRKQELQSTLLETQNNVKKLKKANQELESRIQTIPALRETVRGQELVIKKLEDV